MEELYMCTQCAMDSRGGTAVTGRTYYRKRNATKSMGYIPTDLFIDVKDHTEVRVLPEVVDKFFIPINPKEPSEVYSCYLGGQDEL